MTNSLYYSRKESGLCVRCGAVPPVDGKIMCDPCRVESNASNTASRQRRWAAQGRVPKNRMKWGPKTPEERADPNLYSRRISKERWAAGICRLCKYPVAELGGTYCAAHKKAQYATQRSRRAAGQCVKCGAPAGPESKSLCSDHYAAHRKALEERKSRGVCRFCDSPVANKGGAYCKNRLAKIKARRTSLKAAGACVDCTALVERKGMALCLRCVAKAKNKITARQRAGICARCDSPVEWEGGTLCAKHNAWGTERARAKRAKMIEEFITTMPPRPDGAKPIGVIYQVRNRESGMLYVGRTERTAKARWLDHIQDSRANRKPGQFGDDVRAAALAGRADEVFEVSVLRPFYTAEEGFIFEHEEIDARGTLMPHGYNRCDASLEREIIRQRRLAAKKKVARAA